MPSIGTQTTPSSPALLSRGRKSTPQIILTPPRSRQASGSSSSTLYTDTWTDGSRTPSVDSQAPRRAKRRKLPRMAPPVHVHFDRIEINVAAPPAVPVAPPTTAPQGPPSDPNSWANKIRRFFAPIMPFLRILGTIALFLVERVGFGIRLN